MNDRIAQFTEDDATANARIKSILSVIGDLESQKEKEAKEKSSGKSATLSRLSSKETISALGGPQPLVISEKADEKKPEAQSIGGFGFSPGALRKKQDQEKRKPIALGTLKEGESAPGTATGGSLFGRSKEDSKGDGTRTSIGFGKSEAAAAAKTADGKPRPALSLPTGGSGGSSSAGFASGFKARAEQKDD